MEIQINYSLKQLKIIHSVGFEKYSFRNIGTKFLGALVLKLFYGPLKIVV